MYRLTITDHEKSIFDAVIDNDQRLEVEAVARGEDRILEVQMKMREIADTLERQLAAGNDAPLGAGDDVEAYRG